MRICEKNNGSVRARLLKGASSLFSKKGYTATTVREIVAAAGVTKPVLYYYFKNKEGLYLTLMKEAFYKLDSLIQSVGDYEGNTEEKLRRLCEQTFILIQENVEIVRVMYSFYYGPQQGAPFFDFDAYHLKFIQTVRRIVEEGVRRKELVDGNVEEMSWIILGTITLAMDLYLTHPEWKMDQEKLSRMVKLVLQGIGAKRLMGESNE